MNGAESMASMAAILTSSTSCDSISTAVPPVSREQALLETFFHGLSHFAHEKAKEIVDREKESVKIQLAAEMASSSSPSGRGGVGGGSPSKSSMAAHRTTSPLQQHGSNWLSFLHSLSLLANVEKDYWNLVFVGGSQPSSSLTISFQTLFSRRKESSLKGDCNAVVNELKKIEIVVSPTESKDSLEVQQPSADGFPSEKLLSHLSEQLQAFVVARLRLIEFYEQMHALSSSWSSNLASASSSARMDTIGGSVAGDLIIVLSDIIQSHQKTFHHPILSPLKTTFSTECDILLNLFQAQVEILKWAFLPSLLRLNDAHRKLNDWDALITFQAKKGNFAARGITIGGVVAAKKTGGGSSLGDPLPLYAWLWKFRASLLSKFTFYFYGVLLRQSPSLSEMKTLTAKTDFDFLGKVSTFVRKADALSVSLIYDATAEKSLKGGGGGGGGGGGVHCDGGYRHPESLSGIQDQLTSASSSSSSGSSPSSPSSASLSSGIKTYPVVFSFPPERHLEACEQNHRAIAVSLIHHRVYGKVGCDASSTCSVNANDFSSTVVAATSKGGGAGAAGSSSQILSLFDKTINTTYLMTNVEPNFYLVLIFECKKSEKDSYVAGFLEEITAALQLSHVFRLLRPGSK